MSQDPPPPPETLNPKQIRFTQLYATGLHKGTEAVIIAGYSPGRAKQTAHNLLEREDVQRYLSQLQKRTEEACDMSREELAKFYTDILRAKPSDATESNPIARPVHLKDGTEYELPDKLAASDRLINLMGWNKQADNEAEQASNILKAILQKKDI